MDSDDFASRMRALEYFHSLKLLPGAWAIVRVDGRGFSKLTEAVFQKPFDPRFHDAMVTTARALLEELQGVVCYTQSDEISVVLPPQWDQFDREHEKLVSISAAIATATFTHAIGRPAQFDARVWLGVNESQVFDYFRWRQSDATRCALNTCCYWTLRNTGASVGEATRKLERATISEKNELLFQHGINFNELPIWQRRGVGLYWEQYEKQGLNPKTGETVATQRRRVGIDEEIPMKDDFTEWLRTRLL